MSGLGVAARSPVRAPGLNLQRLFGNQAVQDLAEAPLETALHTPGQRLPNSVREAMEERFGQDFGDVRIHFGEESERSAASERADAYTVGRHVVFGAGHFAPKTNAGRELLAHELAHVVQQSRGGVAPGSGLDPNSPLEASARAAAAAATRGSGPVQVRGASGVGIARQQAQPTSDEERKRLLRDYEARLARARGHLVPGAKGGPIQSYHVQGSGSGAGPGSTALPATPGHRAPPAAPPGPSSQGQSTQGQPGGSADSQTRDAGKSADASRPASGSGIPGGTGTGPAFTELDYAVKLAGIVNLEFGDNEKSVSGGIPGGQGREENASEAGQSLYAALAIFDVISIGKALWSLGRVALKKGAETIAERIAGKAAAKAALREAEQKAIREGLQQAENKNAYIGRKIIGWGEGPAAEAAQKTLKVAETLTEDSVRDMAAKGMTKEWVEKQLALYENAMARGTLEKNAQLNPRRLLMKRMLELWPK